jgi:protein required for attachment to host cells
MNVRVVVADERLANFFDAVKYGAPLAARGTVENPAGGMKDRELETDRAGRRYGGTSGVTHGSGPAAGHHHGVNGERSTERHELALFAKEVAQRIDAGRINHEFDKVILIAGPRMLGLLRQELPQTCKDIVAGEVSKDLVQHEPDAILEALPREAFFQ